MEDRAALDTLIYHTAANAILNSWMTAWKKGGVPLTGVLSSGTVIHRKKLDVHLRALTPAEQRSVNLRKALTILEDAKESLDKMTHEQDKAFDRRDYDRARKIGRQAERTADRAILEAELEEYKPIEYGKKSEQHYAPPQRSVVKLLEFSLRTVGSSTKGIGRIYNGTQQESGKVMLDVALFSKQGQPLGLHQIEILPDPLGAGRIKTFTFELKSPPFDAYKVGIRRSQ